MRITPHTARCTIAHMTTLYSVMAALTFFIMPSQTTLYDSALDPIVDLPVGYFVVKRDAASPNGYTAVAYDDLTGFVKTSEVIAVDYIPVTKYETTVKFVCNNDGQPVNLRSEPRKTAEILRVLDKSESGRCYGTATGDALIANADNVWYYVNANGVKGYCYYAYITVDPTPPNVIEKERQPDIPPDVAQPQSDESAQTMPTVAAVIFIVALCIPVPFVMFYMFRKPKNKDAPNDKRVDK